jgi:hypothetical protein
VTEKKSNKKCFPNVHMTPAEFGLWNICRELSYKSGVFLLDGRKLALRFSNTSKDSVYRAIKTLTGKGWFVLREAKRQGAGGKYSASKYQVLSHDDWVALHGCAECVEQRASEPVAESENARRKTDPHLSQNQGSPVAPVRRICHTSSAQTISQENTTSENLCGGKDGEGLSGEIGPEASLESGRDFLSADGRDDHTIPPVAPVRQAMVDSFGHPEDPTHGETERASTVLHELALMFDPHAKRTSRC